jgi:hypothetical protein
MSFYGNNYDILCYSFILFFPQGLEFLHNHLLYTSSDFSLSFLKIVFILYDVQVVKGECYNINVRVITWHWHEPATVAPADRLACPLSNIRVLHHRASRKAVIHV